MPFSTPLAVDNYSRVMVEAFDERDVIGVPTAWQSMFGKPGSQTVIVRDAAVVEIDIIRGNRQLAALVKRGVQARALTGQANTKEQNFTSFSRVLPLIIEEGDIDANQLTKRIAGEMPYDSSMTRADRQRALGLKHHTEHIRRIIRRDEAMARESILTGQMSALDSTTNPDFIYDFRRTAGLTFTVSPLWDGVSPTIMKNLQDQADLIILNGMVTPDFAVFGASAMAAFLADTDVQALADTRRFDGLVLTSAANPVPANMQHMVDSGMLAYGKLRLSDGNHIWVFSYPGIYENPAASFVDLMPKDKVVMGWSGTRADRYFGPSDILPEIQQRIEFMMQMFGVELTGLSVPNIKAASGVIIPESFFFDAYGSTDHRTVTLRTQHAPLFATTQTDCWSVMTVTS